MKLRSYLPVGQLRPYRATLDAAGQAAYDAIVEGVFDQRDYVLLGVGKREACTIAQLVPNDIPELVFQQPGFSVIYSARKGRSVLVPHYRFGHKDAEALLVAMARNTAGVLRRARAVPDEMERHRLLHDWLIATCRLPGPGWSERNGHLYVAAGALVYHEGVCSAFSRAYKYLADRCGLASCVATGVAGGGEAGDVERHAWNLVRIDGQWYNADVTWDASSSDPHEYLARSDVSLRRTHHPDGALPYRCTATRPVAA